MIGKLKVFYYFSCPPESAATFIKLEAARENITKFQQTQLINKK